MNSNNGNSQTKCEISRLGASHRACRKPSRIAFHMLRTSATN